MLNKRIFDVIVSLVCLIIMLPFLFCVALLLYSTLGSPIFFRQVRSGKNGKPFQILKFRTMLDLKNNQGKALPDKERITRLGSFLRNTSLDEVPELFNVLKGEMSLVGPRPLLMEYLPLYSREQARRHNTLPGITGWAQINGRNKIPWEQKFIYDTWYIDNQSLMLDIKIILITIKRIFTQEGISADGEVTMPKFTGSKE